MEDVFLTAPQIIISVVIIMISSMASLYLALFSTLNHEVHGLATGDPVLPKPRI